MSITAQLIIIGIAFSIALGFGIWLARKFKPYTSAMDLLFKILGAIEDQEPDPAIQTDTTRITAQDILNQSITTDHLQLEENQWHLKSEEKSQPELKTNLQSSEKLKRKIDL